MSKKTNQKKETLATSVRLPDDIATQVRDIAQKQHRSMNSVIIELTEKGLKARGARK